MNLASTRSVRVAQLLWLSLAVTTTGLYVVALALQWTAMQAICHPDSACLTFQLDASSARTLSDHGVSMSLYAAYTAAVFAALWVICYSLAALIVWRKPQDRGALLSAFFLVTWPLLGSASAGFISTGALQNALKVVPFIALILFGLLFPDGRFAPRWTRWLAAVEVFTIIPASIFPNSSIWPIPIILLPIAIVGAQVYRFRSISTWAQRQQTKWALFGLALVILGFSALILPIAFSPTQTQNGSLYLGLSHTGFAIVFWAIPISLAIAVFRSRLWDIDRIISRALVYTALSVTLVATYIGSVVGLQSLFRAITGQQSDLAVAISTLFIAALFNPLRHRIQDVIARTFSRRKYNAQQVLAAFGATCRDETDLEKLKEGMMSAVRQTMQPTHISLWLRESPPKGG
jgi:hypothetical protein